MSIRIGGTDYDYDMEFMVDFTKWKPADSEAGEELFEYPATLQVLKSPYCFKFPPALVIQTAQDVHNNLEEMMQEWYTLLAYNDCCDRKFKVTIKVEEVK